MRKPPPLKWQKYLALAGYGLTSLARLHNDVRRYPTHDWRRLVQDIRLLLPYRSAPEQTLVVVKLVQHSATSALPNVRIQNQSDLKKLESRLLQGLANNYDEIWFCPTPVAASSRSVAGRISVRLGRQYQPQVLEQLWRCSPRLIEDYQYHQPSFAFPYPYFCGIRPSWSWHFTTQAIHVPNGGSETRDSMLIDVAFVATSFLTMKRRITTFFTDLTVAGIREVGLEYKAVGNQFWIIDWDTHADRKALKHLEAACEHVSD